MKPYGKSIFEILSIVIFVLTGCTPPTTITPSSSRETPIPISTQPPATSTFAPTQAGTFLPSTPTKELPLLTGGPYLAFLRLSDNRSELVFMDADGEGRRTFSLPAYSSDPAIPSGLSISYLSPDGKWLAYYTGSAGDCGVNDLSNVGDKNLALNLTEVPSGRTKIVANLLPANYPDNFVTNAEAALKTGLNEELDPTYFNTPAELAPLLKDAFVCGIRSLAWSPDGHTLAFAGGMDGPSSDLYVYDLDTENVRRLSSGSEELRWISWSPDGQWIMHGSNYSVGEGERYNTHAAARDGSVVKTLSQSAMEIADWLDDQTYIQFDGANGPGRFKLQSVDILTGAQHMWWDGSFESFSIDKKNRLMLISAYTRHWPETETPFGASGGLYMVNMVTGSETKLSAQAPGTTASLGIGSNRFFISDGQSSSAFVSAQGTATPTDAFIRSIAVAPDGTHWLAIGDAGLWVFAADGNKISLPLPFDPTLLADAFWRPDSTGIFLVEKTENAYANLYAVTLPNATPILVNEIFPEKINPFNPASYAWVMP